MIGTRATVSFCLDEKEVTILECSNWSLDSGHVKYLRPVHYLITYEYPEVSLFGVVLQPAIRGETEAMARDKTSACEMFLLDKPGAKSISIVRM